MSTRQESMNAKLVMRIASGVFRFILNVLFYIFVVMVVITLSKSAYRFTYQVFSGDPVDEEPGRVVEIQIDKGESKMSVAGKLEQNKAIDNKISFYLRLKLQDSLAIQPGTYNVNSSMTYDEIINVITNSANSTTPIEDTEE